MANHIVIFRHLVHHIIDLVVLLGDRIAELARLGYLRAEHLQLTHVCLIIVIHHHFVLIRLHLAVWDCVVVSPAAISLSLIQEVWMTMGSRRKEALLEILSRLLEVRVVGV